MELTFNTEHVKHMTDEQLSKACNDCHKELHSMFGYHTNTDTLNAFFAVKQSTNNGG